MKVLFLRGSVPSDRDPKQIMFNNIESCDDMWTQLAMELSRDDYGEVLYWGGERKVEYSNNFIERWVPSFKKYKMKFVPDVVFARGGFPEYDCIINRFKDAFKIYYGAGKRFFPQSGRVQYDLILVDSISQKNEVKKRFPKTKVELFFKPAADNIFKPFTNSNGKNYDVIFVGNLSRGDIKGHHFILSSLCESLKILQVGITNKSIIKKYPLVKFVGWVPRKKIPKLYSKCKVSVVASDIKDSCPRVISESLACNCPLIILNSVKFWSEKYIVKDTGVLSDRSNFLSDVRGAVSRFDQFSPYKYYIKNLGVPVASNFISNIISGSRM